MFDYRSPMREKLTYQVTISERDYVGEVQHLKPIGEDFVLTQGQIDDDELVPTKPSELSITLLCTEEGDPLAELFALDATQYLVDVGVCRTTAEGSDVCMTFWSGFISTGSYSQPYAKPPYRVKIHANDGLAILKTLPYLADDGSIFTGVKSIRQHLTELLSPITMRPVRVWPAYQLRVGQTEDTFDTIGLRHESIYAAFGEETPTYYDVLESILRNFGLQLFQSYQAWIARPLSALIAKRRPEWYRDVSEGFGLGSTDRTLPLYGTADDGVGMSTSAVMALRAPLKNITTTAVDTTYSVKPLSARLPELWVPRQEYFTANGNALRPRRGAAGVIFRGYKRYTDWDFLHVFDGVLVQSANSRITVSFKAFNRMPEEVSLAFSIFLQKEVGESISRWYWNNEKSKWERTSTPIDVALPGASFNLGTRRVSVEVMEKSAVECSCSIAGIPVDGHRLGIYLHNSPLFELYNVTIEVETEGITCEEANTPIVISPYGQYTLEIKQKYASTVVAPIAASEFLPAIINAQTEEPIVGLLSPAETNTMAGAIASGIEAMRNDVTRTLEGDVYAPAPIDLNTLWRTRDGRVFYTNYLQTLTKRGVCNVQLCELLPLTSLEDSTVGMSTANSFPTGEIGLGSSVFYQLLLASGLWVTDVNTGKTKLVHEKVAPYLYVRRGYRSICCIDYIQALEANKIVCSAYDSVGAQLSVAPLDNYFISELATSSIQGILETITYDALCDVWYCAYWNGEYLRTNIFDAEGSRLYWADVVKLDTYPDKIAIFPINNGFVLTYAIDGVTFTYLHNNVIHAGSTVETSGELLGDILALQDKYVVLQHPDRFTVKPRTELEVAGTEVVAQFDSTQYEFLCANQVLTVFRKISDRTLKVLDMRTLREVNISDNIFTLGKIWLNGEYVRIINGNKIYKLRISDGDGYIYEELYDSNGQQLRDLEGNVLRVIKE